ncbi:hypothetical protein PM082_014219 [Marasmius tenuissimus]|nr:hypothetical protein PM082_014219 [Marasmius tenuissimus]
MLASLGLTVQLGHLPSETCKVQQHTRIEFTVVNLSGIQDITVTYCCCQINVGSLWQQLLRFRLYPATVNEAATAFTFRTITFFHNLTLQGKVNLFDYYKALEKQTDATGTVNIKDWYEAFIRVMRQWRYLKQMKRAGVGNEVNHDLNALPKGRVAKEVPDKQKYLYNRFIAVDACFHLKGRMISSEKKDPGLLSLAYFVDQTEFQSWVPIKIPEVSSCPGLQAIDQASTELSWGYAQTGTILCICARHEVVEPNGTVDTTKGEKYCLTDYAIASSQKLSDSFLNRVLSYDICCQFCCQFAEQMLLLPEGLRMQIDAKKWQFAVPKLHIQGHIQKCQEEFTFHSLPGAGQTDREGVERHWAHMGPTANSTVEMGPGHCRDTLDDHFSHANHNKNIGQGRLLRKRRHTAHKQSEAAQKEFTEFNDSQDPVMVAEWKASVEDWEQGVTKVNPYAMSTSITTEANIRLSYALEEAQELLNGAPPMHDISPSTFMQAGFHVEDLQ